MNVYVLAFAGFLLLLVTAYLIYTLRQSNSSNQPKEDKSNK